MSAAFEDTPEGTIFEGKMCMHPLVKMLIGFSVAFVLLIEMVICLSTSEFYIPPFLMILFIIGLVFCGRYLARDEANFLIS
jgi:hypothetical protein